MIVNKNCPERGNFYLEITNNNHRIYNVLKI